MAKGGLVPRPISALKTHLTTINTYSDGGCVNGLGMNARHVLGRPKLAAPEVSEPVAGVRLSGATG